MNLVLLDGSTLEMALMMITKRAADHPAVTQEALASRIEREAQLSQCDASSSSAEAEHLPHGDENDEVNQASYDDVNQEAATDEGSKSSYEVPLLLCVL